MEKGGTEQEIYSTSYDVIPVFGFLYDYLISSLLLVCVVYVTNEDASKG